MKNTVAGQTGGGSQAFCLKLNSHQSHMIESFQKLYNEEVMVDCTLSCSGGTIKAHKLVLSACSPYFTSLFSTFTNPYQYPVVVIKDMPFSDLKAIIEFMYRGEVTVPQSILPSVLESAKTLSITGLSDIKIANFDQPSTPGPAKSMPESLFSHRTQPKSQTGNNRNKRSRRRTRRRDNNDADSGSEDGVVSEDGSFDSDSGAQHVSKHLRQEEQQQQTQLESTGMTDGSGVTAGTGDVKEEESVCQSSQEQLEPESQPASQQVQQQQDEEIGEEEEEDDEDGNVAMELAGAVVSEEEDAVMQAIPVPSSSSSGHQQPQQQQRYSASGTKMSPFACMKQDLRQARIQKLQLQTGGLSGRKMWSDDEVRSLVRIWEEESARVWASAGKKLLSLRRISDLLQEEGIDRDISQVEGKIKALKRDYKAVKSDKAITSVQTRMAPFLEKLDRIFDHDTDL